MREEVDRQLRGGNACLLVVAACGVGEAVEVAWRDLLYSWQRSIEIGRVGEIIHQAGRH